MLTHKAMCHVHTVTIFVMAVERCRVDPLPVRRTSHMRTGVLPVRLCVDRTRDVRLPVEVSAAEVELLITNFRVMTAYCSVLLHVATVAAKKEQDFVWGGARGEGEAQIWGQLPSPHSYTSASNSGINQNSLKTFFHVSSFLARDSIRILQSPLGVYICDRPSVCPSVRPSVCHTGGSVKYG